MNKIMDKLIEYDWVDTKYILNLFNLTCSELEGLMEHGYVHPKVFENEDYDFELLWNPKTFYDVYDHIDKLEREYKVVQSIKKQSE
jgi:hypothetical protein